MGIVACFAPMAQYPARRYRPLAVRRQTQDTVVRHHNWSENSSLRWATLFVTTGTLLCCALPILLVALGLGTVIATFYYTIPGLSFFAEHQSWTLGLSAFLLLMLAWLIWRPGQSCPAEPELAAHCLTARYWNIRVFRLSVVIWSIGLFSSVFLLPLSNLLGSLR